MEIVACVPVNVCAGTVPPDPAKVGTPAGQATVPAGVKEAVPLVPTGVNDTVPFVGTPAGHATVPEGVKLTVPFVGTPAGHATVPEGVPAETAWLRATAAAVALLVGVIAPFEVRDVPVPNVLETKRRALVALTSCMGSS